MAERRMFAKQIIDSDAFLEMPQSSQSLYFHLGMRADDDGFVNNPKKIQRMIGASDDDLKILLAKNFLIPFDSGIVVIKHWKIHNYLRSDRYKPTVYTEEKAKLSVKPNGAYSCNSGIPLVDKRETQDRLGKDRLGKDRLGKDRLEKEEEAIFEKPLENKFTRIESARLIWNEVMPNKPYRYTALNMGEQVRSECLRPMSVYSDDEIGEAIRNYARILASPEHEIKSPFESFHGFMRTGVEKFDSGADPWSAYKKKAKGFESAGEREDRERAEAIARLTGGTT